MSESITNTTHGIGDFEKQAAWKIQSGTIGGITATAGTTVIILDATTDKLALDRRDATTGARITADARVIENEIWISVTDHGKGIAESDLTRFFDKFVQVEESAMGLGSGTGLGLAIAKEIVLADGGRIWAASTLGEGATLTIALPLIKHTNS